jgi:hypothetical protein
MLWQDSALKSHMKLLDPGITALWHAHMYSYILCRGKVARARSLRYQMRPDREDLGLSIVFLLSNSWASFHFGVWIFIPTV